MGEVELSAGTIHYDEVGSGPTVVLVHGVWMGGSLWQAVVDQLSANLHCVVPDLPLGAHFKAMDPGADLSLRGHAALLAELLERLDLSDVTLVFNDWCAAQVMIADGRVDRVGRLVLVGVETDDNYPPGLPGRMLGFAGRIPGGLAAPAHLFRFEAVRNLPMTFGRMTRHRPPRSLVGEWFTPARRDRAVRRDLRKYVGDTRRGTRDLQAATRELGTFGNPVLVIWGAQDRVMPRRSGKRLAAAFPNGRFVEVPDAATLVPLDQPARLAELIDQFVREPAQAT